MLRAFFFYLIFFPWTLLAILILLCCALIGGQDRAHNFGIKWGKSCLWLAGLKLKISGSENLPPKGPVIYASNHQSNFDIPILYAGLPLQFRWLAKQELFDIPLFGSAMKQSGYIAIDRSNRRKSLESFEQAVHKIKGGTSVIIFPEGTRTNNGQVQPFKKGALLLAAKAAVPVVPITIKGSFQVQPKGSLKIFPGQIELIISAPLDTTGMKSHDVEGLTEQIHDTIAHNLKEPIQHD